MAVSTRVALGSWKSPHLQLSTWVEDHESVGQKHRPGTQRKLEMAEAKGRWILLEESQPQNEAEHLHPSALWCVGTLSVQLPLLDAPAPGLFSPPVLSRIFLPLLLSSYLWIVMTLM